MKLMDMLKAASKNNPRWFALFLFAALVAVLDIVQIIVILFCAFR